MWESADYSYYYEDYDNNGWSWFFDKGYETNIRVTGEDVNFSYKNALGNDVSPNKRKNVKITSRCTAQTPRHVLDRFSSARCFWLVDRRTDVLGTASYTFHNHIISVLVRSGTYVMLDLAICCDQMNIVSMFHTYCVSYFSCS